VTNPAPLRRKPLLLTAWGQPVYRLEPPNSRPPIPAEPTQFPHPAVEWEVLYGEWEVLYANVQPQNNFPVEPPVVSLSNPSVLLPRPIIRIIRLIRILPAHFNALHRQRPPRLLIDLRDRPA
jgi:hypothetical protein